MSASSSARQGLIIGSDNDVKEPVFDFSKYTVIPSTEAIIANITSGNEAIPNNFTLRSNASVTTVLEPGTQMQPINAPMQQMQQRQQFTQPNRQEQYEYAQQQMFNPQQGNIFQPSQYKQYIDQQSMMQQQQQYAPSTASFSGDQAKAQLSQILTDSANDIAAAAGKSSVTQQSLIDIDKLIDKFIEDQNKKGAVNEGGMELDLVNEPINLEPVVNNSEDLLKDLPENYPEEKKMQLLKIQEQNRVLMEQKMEQTKEKIRQHRLSLQNKLSQNFPVFAAVIQQKTGRPFDRSQMKDLVNFVSGIPLLKEEEQKAFNILLDAQASINEKQADHMNMILSGYKKYREVCTEQTNQLSAKERLLQEKEAKLKQLEEENLQLKSRSVPYGSIPEQRFQTIQSNASVGSSDMYDSRGGKRAMTVNSRAVTGTGASAPQFHLGELNALGQIAYVASKRTDPMMDEFYHQTKGLAWDGMLRLIRNENWEGKKVMDIPFFKKIAESDEQKMAKARAYASGYRPDRQEL